MKKKLMMLIAVLGMAFAGAEVNAQETQELVLRGCGMVIIDYDYWGTGNYVACLKGGGSCECGSVSGCQGGWW